MSWPESAKGDSHLPSVARLEEAMRSGKRALDEGRLDEAVGHFSTALKLKPNYGVAWVAHGHALRKKGDLEGALRSFAEAVVLDARNEDAWMSLSATLHGLGRIDEEIEAYNELLQANPRNVDAWINKGAALHERKRYGEAAACYDAVLRIRPEHAAAWNNKGAALMRQGHFAEAVVAFGEALHFDPAFHDALTNKVFCLQRLGKHGETVLWADRALAIRESPLLWHLKGLSHLGLLESSAAVTAFERALALDPGLKEARRGLQRARRLRKKVDLYRGVYECFGTIEEGDPGCAECEIQVRCREVSP